MRKIIDIVDYHYSNRLNFFSYLFHKYERLMELMTTKRYESDSINKFETQIKEMNLIYYASEASREINFRNPSEFPIAVNRAMEIILSADISLDHNFKQIYKCSDNGIFCDWKLSTLAFRLVCLNLDELIPEEIQKEIESLKNKC